MSSKEKGGADTNKQPVAQPQREALGEDEQKIGNWRLSGERAGRSRPVIDRAILGNE
jgi:hypothetical protein